MHYKFTPSINIERDFNKDFDYIVTSNVNNVYNKIVNLYKSGIQSFNIIGSYGTGKSSFLLALAKNFAKKENYFGEVNGQFAGFQNFEVLQLIGEYDSFENLLKNKIPFQQNLNLFQNFELFYQNCEKENKFLIVLIDEFGKILEYAANNNPEKELFFIQQLAEFVNDTNRKIILINTLHQSFRAYSNLLNTTQQQEWEKVKGRFADLAFNEPVEQLMSIAAKRISKFNFEITDKIQFEKLYQLIEKSNLIQYSKSINYELALGLYPFDILAAAIITKAFQKHGQNDRSLFTFLETNEDNGIRKFKPQTNLLYNISVVYDYLFETFFTSLSTKSNPDFNRWAYIFNAIDKVETTFAPEFVADAKKLIKTIGLINIFTEGRGAANKQFLVYYAENAMQINNALQIIETLEKHKIIRFAYYKSKYNLFEGTDLDFEAAIVSAGTKIDKVESVADTVNKYFETKFLPAKAVHYKYGTPRFFEYVISTGANDLTPEGEIDGYINLIFNDKLTETDIREHSKTINQPIIFALYTHTAKIKNTIWEIDKIQYVIRDNFEDKAALKELQKMLSFEEHFLNQLVLETLYREKSEIVWIYKGEIIPIQNRTIFNKTLSNICTDFYADAPVMRNELFNRSRLSGAISTARRFFIEALLKNTDIEDFGFDKTKFPPEKTIYLTLLKATGMHKKSGNYFELKVPEEQSFMKLWETCEGFMESAKARRTPLTKLVDLLIAPPFGLKKGFLDFWIPVFLFIKKEDFALYYKNRYVPALLKEDYDLMYRSFAGFEIKTFDVSGVRLNIFNKYRELVNQEITDELKQKSFIQTIQPFISFYTQLTEFAKNTKRLPKHAIRLREAIAAANDIEKTFFVDFPNALGYKDLDLNESENTLIGFSNNLKNSITEIQRCYTELIEYIESNLLKSLKIKSIDFETYKKEIQKRYKDIKTQLLFKRLQTFYARLNSPLDDKTAWFSSLTMSILDKPLDKITDAEIPVLLDRLNDTFYELDNLIEVHKAKTENPRNEIIKFALTTLNSGTTQKQLIILPESQKDVDELETELLHLLSKREDKNVVRAALLKTIQKKM